MLDMLENWRPAIGLNMEQSMQKVCIETLLNIHIKASYNLQTQKDTYGSVYEDTASQSQGSRKKGIWILD